jgi:hypothetical protein
MKAAKAARRAQFEAHVAQKEKWKKDGERKKDVVGEVQAEELEQAVRELKVQES